MQAKYDYKMVSEKMDEVIKMAQEVKEECASASPQDWNISEKIAVEIPDLLDDIWTVATRAIGFVTNPDVTRSLSQSVNNASE